MGETGVTYFLNDDGRSSICYIVALSLFYQILCKTYEITIIIIEVNDIKQYMRSKSIWISPICQTLGIQFLFCAMNKCDDAQW